MSLYRSPRERAQTWLVTGPVGHFAGGTADWLVLFRRWAWARARGRNPWE